VEGDAGLDSTKLAANHCVRLVDFALLPAASAALLPFGWWLLDAWLLLAAGRSAAARLLLAARWWWLLLLHPPAERCECEMRTNIRLWYTFHCMESKI